MRPSPTAIWLAASLVILLTGCGGTAAPDVQPASASAPGPATAEPAPAPEPTAETFDALEANYAPGLDTLHQMVESTEERRPEILRREREKIERDRAEVARLDAEIEALAAEMSATAEQLGELRKNLEQLRQTSGQKAGDRLEQEAVELRGHLHELGNTRKERKQHRDELAASVAERAALSDDQLFRQEVQTLYRETVDLQRSYYRDGIHLAKQKLAGQEASFLVDHYESRIRQRTRELEQGALTEEVVRTFRRQQESDRRMEAALYLAYVLEVRFPSSRHELQEISLEERENLELLSEALRTGWDEWGELRIHIDGHADSQAFRNVRACVSATRNLELSRQRAMAVRDFLQRRLGEESRFAVDWFGNFALRADADPTEKDNRRIELRIASDAQQDSGVHAAYFSARRGVDLQGRTFVREPGRWVEASCDGNEPASRVEYLSREYESLMDRLGFEADQPTQVDLGEGRELLVRLGTHAVVADGDACVEVVPCTIP